MKDLNGRVAVVTGAASGIGAGIARTLASRGCHLALADVNMDRLGEFASTLDGVTVTTHHVDVADREQVNAFAQRVVSHHGAAHLVFNNAGVAVMSTFDSMPIEDFERVVNINLWGVVYGCYAFLPILMDQDAGHIVNISSLFGIIGVPGQTAYCASKFAVKGFSDSLATELADTKVGLTVVHPGAIATRIAADATYHKQPTHQSEAKAKKIIRAGMPSDEAGRRIVRAVEKGKRRLFLGNDAKLLATIQRLLPTKDLDLMTIDPTSIRYKRKRKR
jgi:NAD(P)-dependent dehydrogenase (short-subunit alcohol dehydrogenase family)